MQTKFLFYSGKGGVGKTTMSCATAIHYAKEGKKTLVITTDPASNLADVFEQPIGHKITPIKSIKNLSAMELDPDKATNEYKERTLSPLRGLIPIESFRILEEQLNSPCTAEMASFDRFTDFVQDGKFEVVIFDTAPTGHTLRLLELPVEWSGVIEKAAKDNSGGQTCIGPAAALAESKAKFDRAISAMRNPDMTTFVFVLRPESTPIYEAKRSITELSKLGINSQEIIVNGVYPKEACDNPFMIARFMKQQQFLSMIKKEFKVPAKVIELGSSEVKGIDRLSTISTQLFDEPSFLSKYAFKRIAGSKITAPNGYAKPREEITKLLTPLNGNKRVIFFAGKGGVGKSSVSAATALWIANNGFKTLLLTTDPASHLRQIFDQKVTDKPTLLKGENNLWFTHIDAKLATQEYKDNILNEARKKYDEKRVLAIEEELDSPCTEEMATFEKFMEFVTLKSFDVIVFDTAPTGHTLRLLELPVEWNKQLEIKTFTTTGETEVDKITKSRFKEVIDLLQDPKKSTFSFVMYPESTPIEEASRAIDELQTIKVPTSLIIANLVIPESVVTNDYLRQRKAMQEKYLGIMEKRFNAPIVTLPLLTEDLMGKDNLVEAGLLLYGKPN